MYLLPSDLRRPRRAEVIEWYLLCALGRSHSLRHGHVRAQPAAALSHPAHSEVPPRLDIKVLPVCTIPLRFPSISLHTWRLADALLKRGRSSQPSQ